MEALKANMGSLIVGTIAFGILAAALIRLIVNFRRGKTGCSCGCSKCESREEP
ncbi:MAG: FeoB-associated Cys-rich membrane protein [Treponema sp.]|jgi:hypothetical protein|nr:FeoB-associated Cys-rich membrane protein [Treponema sp.]